MKIAILDDYQDTVRHLDCFSLLRDHDVKVFTSSARGLGQLALRLAPFDALILIRERSRLSRQLLNKLPNLKLIVQTGRLGSHIDIAAARERGIVLTEGADDARATAELTWALILAASRKLTQYASCLKLGAWQTASLTPAHNTIGRRLQGLTLGVWGYGRVGRIVASYGQAFGMQVLVWGSEAGRTAARQDGFQTASSKQDFFTQSDVISLHLRLSDSTRSCVSATDFACMKPDALFVNTSHAALVESGALENALLSRRLSSAALDVFESEPPTTDSPLLNMENVVATPHLGFVEKESYERDFGAAFQSVLDFAAGRLKREC